MFGRNQILPRQLLQNLRHQRGRDAIFLGDFIRAARMLVAMVRKMLHRNQTVICFFRELEHFLSYPSPATNSPIETALVAFKRYPKEPLQVKTNTLKNAVNYAFAMTYTKTE